MSSQRSSYPILLSRLPLYEAWKIASDERSDAITIIREGRKYQFGLIVASQNPTDVNETIFSNVGTTIMLRVRFEKFISYLQGSLNFSNFMRSEISKFGVGQAAIDMSFQTSVQFPNVFVLDRIVGEIPLDVYTLTVADILNDNELADKSILRDYSFEKIDLNSRFVQMNLASDTITKLFAALDSKNRIVDMRTLVQIFLKENVNKETILIFMRSIGLPDTIISRALIIK